MFMPTVKKKRPSSRPLKGSMVVSIALRNSVSASSSPATNAPECHRQAGQAGGDRAADDHEQGCGHEQLARSRGGDEAKQRPEQQPADDDDDPDGERGLASASTSPASTELPVRLPRKEMNSSIGTTARSWASRIEKLVRPAVVVRRRWLERISMTMAVEDSARHAPMIDGAAGADAGTARRWRRSRAVQSTTCRLPSPNTRRRMVTRRW